MATERRLIARPHEIAGFLAGTQTQFRRAVKLRDPSGTYSAHADDGWPESADEFGQWHRDRCPYGEPGDRLWVAEAWHTHFGSLDAGSPLVVQYRTDGGKSPFWKSSVRMPRHLSRITLELVSVRVERVQERYTRVALWNEENPSHPWESNPWVWACTVRKAVAGG